jgi:hypothetical protein
MPAGFLPKEPLDQARGLTLIASIMRRSYACLMPAVN